MRWIKYLFVSTASPAINMTFFESTRGKLFFFCKRSEPVLPYHLFSNNFFASTTSLPPVFIQKLHCALISNVKEVNPILFCESSEPTRPCDLLFLWILHGMWELSIWRASNLYSKVQRANQPLWSVFCEKSMAHEIQIWMRWIKSFFACSGTHPPHWPAFAKII